MLPFQLDPVFVCCCRPATVPRTLPRIELVVDNIIESIPELEVVDELTGAVIGSSSRSGADPEQIQFDVAVTRPNISVSSTSSVVLMKPVQQSDV